MSVLSQLPLFLYFILAVLITASCGHDPQSGNSSNRNAISNTTANCNLYVATTGSDTNIGSASMPFQTIQRAANAAYAGATICIGAGTYSERVNLTVSGTSSAPVTYTSYNGAVTLDGSPLPTVLDSGDSRCGTNQNVGIIQMQSNYNTVTGLTVTRSNNTGIVLNANNLVVDRCEVSYSQRHGISTNTGRQGTSSNLIKNITIQNNNVHDNTLWSQNKTKSCGQAISLIADGFVIQGNTVHDNITEGIDVWLGATRGKVSKNSLYCNGQTNLYLGGCSYVQVTQNYVYGANNCTITGALSLNRAGIGVSEEYSSYHTYPTFNNQVYNNIVFDIASTGITLWSSSGYGATDTLVAFNTLVNNPTQIYISGTSTATLMNNLGYLAKSNVYSSSSGAISQSYNLWAGSNPGFTYYAIYQPLLDNFSLLSGSPATHYGVAAPSFPDGYGNNLSITSDYAGTSRPTSSPDVGAYQYTTDTPPPTDTTAPSISITNPVNGVSVSGIISVQGSASDNIGVTKIEFYVDSALKYSGTSSSYAFDSTTVPNGSHSLMAKAYDAAGNVGSSSIVSINVNNPIPDTTALTVSITSPSDGAIVQRRSTITISASASDDIGVTKVEFYVNGSLKCTSSIAPYSCSYRVPNAFGKYYGIQAKAYDAANNVGLSSIVTVRAQ